MHQQDRHEIRYHIRIIYLLLCVIAALQTFYILSIRDTIFDHTRAIRSLNSQRIVSHGQDQESEVRSDEPLYPLEIAPD